MVVRAAVVVVAAAVVLVAVELVVLEPCQTHLASNNRQRGYNQQEHGNALHDPHLARSRPCGRRTIDCQPRIVSESSP